jgi:hypothetical protein
VTRASAALESVDVECNCVKYLRLRRKGELERENGRRVAIPFCLSRFFPVGEEASSFVHDVHGWSEGEIPCVRTKGPPAPALAGSARLTHCLSSSISMDILPENDGVIADTPPFLSYDQDVAYEDQVLADAAPPSLANRIGRSKVYLLSESNITRGSKVRV